MKLRTLTHFFVVIISSVIILSYGKTLLIPFVFALLLWFTIREIRNFLDRINFVRNKFPAWIKNILTSVFILIVLTFASRLISSSIRTLAVSYRKYEANVDLLINNLNDLFNINLAEIIKAHLGDLNFGLILSSLFNSLSEIISSTFMIIIYALFIFLEEANFETKVRNVFKETNRFDKIMLILNRIENSVAKYLGLKTLVSLITGVLSYIVLLIIGIDSPLFWAFLIFLLNYIPTIGSLIGTIFPAMFSLLQFGSFMPGFMILIFVGAIQILVGNILEPKLMGNSMNLSPLMTIVALSFWGVVWGITGMILSIPITVILVIIFSQFPATKPVAVMLSVKGKVD